MGTASHRSGGPARNLLHVPSLIEAENARERGHGVFLGWGREIDRAEIPPGTLDMLILKTLKRLGPMHGYGIAKAIQQTTEDVLRVEEGSLYPALQRILKKGWVTAEWVQAGPKRRNRIYRPTPEGRARLAAEISEYRRVAQAIERVIEPA